MTEHRAGQGASDDSAHSHEVLRSLLRHLAEPIVNQVRELVPAFGGPAGGRRHQLMNTAAIAAFRAYLADSPERDAEMRKVDELFRRLGWGEAQSDDRPENLEFALTIGTMATTKYLSSYATTHGLPVAAVYEVLGGLFDYTDHLRSELMEGYALGLRNPLRAKRRLWELLRRREAADLQDLIDTPLDLTQLHEYAAVAGWNVPERVVAIAVDDDGTAASLAIRPDLLIGKDAGWHVLVVPEQSAEDLLRELSINHPDATAVLAWPSSLENAHAAITWVSRAGGLIDMGVIPRAPLIKCSEQATQIWLHSEPVLRETMAQDILEPLLAESYNSRTILSETLLTWLETRDSAPAIAARLDVHPQTIRYRWRRINELFGTAMQDPEFLVTLTMLLKASVPMWQSGDHRDFERYKATHRVPDDLDEVDDPLLG
jgi:hypothetical protein